MRIVALIAFSTSTFEIKMTNLFLVYSSAISSASTSATGLSIFICLHYNFKIFVLQSFY